MRGDGRATQGVRIVWRVDEQDDVSRAWIPIGAALAAGCAIAKPFWTTPWLWFGVAVGLSWMVIAARGGLR